MITDFNDNKISRVKVPWWCYYIVVPVCFNPANLGTSGSLGRQSIQGLLETFD